MERFRQIRSNWPVFALIALYVYLAFHALSGSQGVLRWVDYESDIESQRKYLSQLVAKREILEARADSLKANGLNLDALDMTSREMLFVSGTNEMTIWLDREPQN